MQFLSWIVWSVFILSLQVEGSKNVRQKQGIVIDSAGLSLADHNKTSSSKQENKTEHGGGGLLRREAYDRRRPRVARDRRRRPNRPAEVKPKISSDPQKATLDFGGQTHKVDIQGDWMRPELVKTQVCEDDTLCSECTDKSACWHGGIKGALRLKVPASSPHHRFVAEVWARCSDGKGKWGVQISISPQNGVLNIYVDGELFQTVTSSSYSLTQKYGRPKVLHLPIVKDSRVRVEFVRTDTASEANSDIILFAEDVDAYVDSCMGVKNCLVDLGDGSDGAFRLRNSNAKQYQCISATTTAEQKTVSDHCPPWVTCLAQEPGRKERLKILLRVGVGKDGRVGKGRLLERKALKPGKGSAKNQPHCIDPAVEDAESWDCECMHEMETSCGGANEACFRAILCGQEKVCSQWKDENCESSFSLIAKQNASTKESALTMRREVGVDSTAGTQKQSSDSALEESLRVGANSIAGTRLDSALDGKCVM